MPWYAWLIVVLVFASLFSGLWMLLRANRKLPLTPEQLERIRQRNIEQDAKDAEEAARR